jgi:hypothetical protein
VHSLGVAEEWPVEGAKTKIILTALVISVIVIASIGFYLIKDDAGGISALDGYDIAKSIVDERYENYSYILTYVFPWGDVNNNGLSEGWSYYMTVDKQTYFEGFMIRVYSNLSYDFEGPGTSNLEPTMCHVTAKM